MLFNSFYRYDYVCLVMVRRLVSCYSRYYVFFFQAEDGIRDYKVTGVQTCALPISHRSRPLRILFFHREADTVECCLQELKKAQFVVSADTALDLTQCTEQLRSQSYDVVVAEYPSPSWKGSQGLQFLRQTVEDTPLLFVTTSKGKESIVELTAHGAFDYVEGEHIAQLPMAVRRALNEKKLRAELEDAERALRHSQSLYHALVDNPAYGIFRCDAQGKVLNVNQALVTMLGYATKEEIGRAHV